MGVDAVSLDYPNGPAKGYENKVMSLEVQTGITFSLMQYMYIGTIYMCVCVLLPLPCLKLSKGCVLCRSPACSWANLGTFVNCNLSRNP